jgi:hypothetical protein
MLGVIDAQSQWGRSLTWIDGIKQANIELCTALQVACGQLLSLRWNEHISISGSPGGIITRQFTHLLSDGCINDTLIDMMFCHLSERAEQDTTLDSFMIIENLWFIHDINKATSENDHSSHSPPF